MDSQMLDIAELWETALKYLCVSCRYFMILIYNAEHNRKFSIFIDYFYLLMHTGGFC